MVRYLTMLFEVHHLSGLVNYNISSSGETQLKWWQTESFPSYVCSIILRQVLSRNKEGSHACKQRKRGSNSREMEAGGREKENAQKEQQDRERGRERERE